MRTGWTSGAPDSLSQRDDKLNNILVETQSSNFFKHDFDETTYPRLLETIKEVAIPQDLYNPDLCDPDLELWEAEETTALANVSVDCETFEREANEDSFVLESLRGHASQLEAIVHFDSNRTTIFVVCERG